MDIVKQEAYWSSGAREDFQVARDLLEKGHKRHGLFFLHLALEKMLKAFVCRETNDYAPRIHNLVRLAQESGLAFDDERMAFMAEMNQYNIEGRYPEKSVSLPPDTVMDETLQRTGELFAWLTNQLENR